MMTFIKVIKLRNRHSEYSINLARDLAEDNKRHHFLFPNKQDLCVFPKSFYAGFANLNRN